MTTIVNNTGADAPRVELDIVGSVPGDAVPEWPAGWPVPQVGDAVTLPVTAPGVPLIVRAVDWMPEGDGDGEDDGPLVYVVLAPAGRSRGHRPRS